MTVLYIITLGLILLYARRSSKLKSNGKRASKLESENEPQASRSNRTIHIVVNVTRPDPIAPSQRALPNVFSSPSALSYVRQHRAAQLSPGTRNTVALVRATRR